MKTSRILATAMTGVLLSASLCFAAQKENVRVTDVAPNKIVVKRDNGAKFELRLGSGCPAVRNYLHKDVMIRSSDKFLDHTSKVILHRENQQCPVIKFARIQGPTKNNGPQNGKPHQHR